MSTGHLRESLEGALWPQLESLVGRKEVAGLAVAVVREGEVVSHGFGARDVGSGAPVTPETMFHLASVSKPFVATAIVSLSRDGDRPLIDLDAPITQWVPELTLADGREDEVTARTLLSHSSGLPDVTEYGWHDPQLGDDALSEFARSLSGWRLQADPGASFSYSNAGFELLGLLLSRAVGTTFEAAVKQHVLTPLGMRRSTFLRSEVPRHLAASPHVGMPLCVPEGAYPYTRRHAPSSTLHSNLDEMCRWVVAHLEPSASASGDADRQWVRLDAGLVDQMWRPVMPVAEPPWEEAAALGWAVGEHRGHRAASHSGMDPGFGSKLVLLPERRIGVVVLANSNTVPTLAVAAAALDIALKEPGDVMADLRAMRPSGVSPVAEALTASGPDAAKAAFHRLADAEPTELDLDDDAFIDAVWGAIELHRTSLVWPLLRLWADLRPESSEAETMTGWAHQVDGDIDLAREHLGRALDRDPENGEAKQIMSGLPPERGVGPR